MTVSWNKGLDPQQIILRLEQNRTTDRAGNATFEGFTYRECTVLLYDLLAFPAFIPEVEGRRIVSQATTNAGKKGIITSGSLKSEVCKLTDAYLKRPLEIFVLATSLSLYRYSDLRSIRVNNATIKFGHDLPKHFAKARERITPRNSQALFANLPTDYLTVRVSVSARSVYEAADAGLDALDLVRAIWNWFYNRRSLTRISSGSPSPVNEIVLGPIHTLHKPSGELASETFWYEPSYRAPVRPQNLTRDIVELRKFYQSVATKLRGNRYHEDLEKALIRYGRALDERDWHTAFLKLWGVLEFLTSTTRKDSHEKTIQRAAYVFVQHDYQLQALKILGEHRNQLVHANVSTEEIEAYMYILKRSIESLFNFHLVNVFGFASLKDAAAFLDLPVDLDALNSRVRLARGALRFRGYK